MFHKSMIDAGSGASSERSFWENWDRVKNYLFDLVNLPSNFDAFSEKAARLKGLAKRMKRPDLVAKVNKHVQWANANESTKIQVQDKIAAHLPSWKKKASEPKNVFSAISLFLGGAALLALGYVASKGMDLLSEYQTRKQALSLLEQEVISAEEAQGLIEASKGGTIQTAIKKGFIKAGMGIAFPIVGLIGGLIAAKMIWEAYAGAKVRKAKEVYGKAKDVWGAVR